MKNRDPLIINKILASVLVGGLIIMGSKYIVDIIYPHHQFDKPAYFIEVPEKQTLVQEIEIPPISSRLTSVAHLGEEGITYGQSIFKKCVACHTIKKDGKNKVGPNLWGVVNAKAARIDGFSYSPNLPNVGTWSFENLDQYLTKPNAFVKGTKMSFAGIKNPMQRAAVIVFLNSNSDKPLDIE